MIAAVANLTGTPGGRNQDETASERHGLAPLDKPFAGVILY
jgi:hypothetical protein